MVAVLFLSLTLAIIVALLLLLRRYAVRTHVLTLATCMLGLVALSSSYGTYYATSLSGDVQLLQDLIARFRKPPPMHQGYSVFLSPEVERFREIFRIDEDPPRPSDAHDATATERIELARLLLEMGNYLYEANSIRDATTRYEESVASYPSGPAYNNLALCYLLAGRTEDGIRYLELSASHAVPSRYAGHNLVAAQEHRAWLLLKFVEQRPGGDVAVLKYPDRR